MMNPFSSPDVPEPEPVKEEKKVDKDKNLKKEAAAEVRKKKRRKGLASTILTDGGGTLGS